VLRVKLGGLWLSVEMSNHGTTCSQQVREALLSNVREYRLTYCVLSTYLAAPLDQLNDLSSALKLSLNLPANPMFFKQLNFPP
jgi:hypothetical protein